MRTASARRSSTQHARKSRADSSHIGDLTNTGKTPGAGGTPGSFAGELKVWDAFTGRYYAEGQAPKAVLHTQGGTPAVTAPESGSKPEQSFSAQGIPESIRLDAPSADSAIFNSARSVTANNAEYNRNATEAYEYQLQNWKDNNGRRWLNGQWTQTEIPPPPPVLKETVFDKVLERIRSGQVSITPIPYYMGNAHAGQIYDYNAPLSYGGDTTTFEVSATGQPLGSPIATPQGQQFASNSKPGGSGKSSTA
jgi:hypothetical protein